MVVLGTLIVSMLASPFPSVWKHKLFVLPKIGRTLITARSCKADVESRITGSRSQKNLPLFALFFRWLRAGTVFKHRVMVFGAYFELKQKFHTRWMEHEPLTQVSLLCITVAQYVSCNV